MRHRPAPRLLALAVLALTGVLTACGGGSGERADPGPDAPAGSAPPAAEEPTVDDDRDPVEVVTSSVDATLDVERLTLASTASLNVEGQSFGVFADGPADWATGTCDLSFGVQQGTDRTEVTVLGDGTDAWLTVDGPQAPALPDGATWVQGEADDLVDAGGYAPVEFLAAIVALRAASDVEEFDAETHDGVTTRVFSTTVTYADAVRAAGEDAASFRTALSLTGEAEQSELDIEVAIGPDDVIRTYDLAIDSDAEVSGGYDIEISDVDRDVEVPTAPDPDEVATGPDARQVLTQLLG